MVTTFTEWLTGLIARRRHPEFFSTPDQSFGAFLKAVVSFALLAAVVYFFVVTPYIKAKERFFPSEESGTPADMALLEEIRDLLKTRSV